MSVNLSELFPPSGGSSGGDSAGAGMVIQPTEPADPITGLQWMDSTTGRIWIWDDDKWLELPAGGGGDASSGGSGGGAWEHIETISADGVSAVEIDIPEGEFKALRVLVQASGNQSGSAGRTEGLGLQVRKNGSYINTGYRNSYNELYVNSSHTEESSATYFNFGPASQRERAAGSLLNVFGFSDPSPEGLVASWQTACLTSDDGFNNYQVRQGGGVCNENGPFNGIKVAPFVQSKPMSLWVSVEGVRK
jgi:hypothetical protein